MGFKDEPEKDSLTPKLDPNRKKSGLKKIDTSLAVNEIQEIENDESPNRRIKLREKKPTSMGFQPENPNEVGFNEDGNGLPSFDTSKGFDNNFD